jgi:hypothetical protein
VLAGFKTISQIFLENRKKVFYIIIIAIDSNIITTLGETMLAYYVHDSETENDIIVLPDRGCRIAVDAKRLEAFISVDPNFAGWSGDACGDLSPEDFGVVIATRDDQGDVCVINHDLWRRRMEFYLGNP